MALSTIPDQPDSAVSNEAEPPNTSADRDDPDNAAVSSDAAGQASLVERLNERFPPVYLLVFDELPWYSLLDETGRIDPVRYPNFARLAETSHVFNNATTVGSTTEVAVTALLASTLMNHSAPVYSMYPDNLFTLLGGVYDISSWDPLVDLCPESSVQRFNPTRGPRSDRSRRHRTGNHQHHHNRRVDNHCHSFLDDLICHHHEFRRPQPSRRCLRRPTTRQTQATKDHWLCCLRTQQSWFGHLVAPEGMDLGIPSIGAGWGSFGGGLTTTTVPTPTTAQEPIATAASTTTTTQVPITTTTQVPITTTTQVSTTTTTPPAGIGCQRWLPPRW